MEERVEKFGSSKKLKRFHNKKQRSNQKQHLKGVTVSYKDIQEQEHEDDVLYEEFEREKEWMRMENY